MPIEEGFITDRLTEQSNEPKAQFSYTALEADDEHVTSNQLTRDEPCSSQKQPSNSFSMKKEQMPVMESYP